MYPKKGMDIPSNGDKCIYASKAMKKHGMHRSHDSPGLERDVG